MSFTTGENENKTINDGLAADKGSERKPRKPRDERDAPIRQNTGRMASFRNIGEYGRAEEMHKTYQEIVKTQGGIAGELLPVIGDVRRELSDEFGYLIYLTQHAGETFWHLLVLESQKCPVIKRPVNDRGARRRDEDVYEFFTTTDGITVELNELMEDYIKTAVENAGTLVATSVTVVPCEIDVTDPAAIRPFLMSADEANWTIAGIDEPFNGDYLPEGGSVRGSLNFQVGATAKDLSNQPLRADFVGSIREHLERTNPNLLMANDKGDTFVTFAGYVDARYVGVRDDGDRRRRRDEEVETACFAPEVVMTEVDLYHETKNGPLARLALALSFLPQLNTNFRWVQQFAPSTAKNQLRDITGFGYGFDPDGPIAPDRILATAEDLHDDKTFNRLLDKIFDTEDGVDFAYLIREGGVGYATSKVLIDLYNGSEAAEDALIQALDDLTDNEFSRLWNKVEDQTIVADVLRLPNGYYTAEDGIRPIEDIDMLAVLNRLTNKNDDYLDDYLACTTPGDDCPYDYNERMTRLVAIYDYVTGRTFVQKGVSTKAWFGSDFLECVFAAVERSDLALTMDVDGDSSFGRRSRAVSRRHGVANNLARRESRRHNSRTRSGGYVNTSYRRGAR